jgi:hypothetical protein
MKLQLSPQIFKKYSSFKFNENLSSGSRVAEYGRTNQTVAFRNFANEHKNTDVPLFMLRWHVGELTSAQHGGQLSLRPLYP